MGEILRVLEDHSGGTCYQTERFTLDRYTLPTYQDAGEIFSKSKIFETDNKKRQNIRLDIGRTGSSLFKFFLDGSRRTYKIVDFGTADGKFVPIIAGQIGAAVCQRNNQRLKKHRINRQNVIAIPDRVGDEFDTIAREIPRIRIPKHKPEQSIGIDLVLQYSVDKANSADGRFEDLAVAQIQTTMHRMEIDLISGMVASNELASNQMLMIDGSLQFINISDKLAIFQDVIGISKSFNPNLAGLLMGASKKQIGTHLTDLDYCERTPVFKLDRGDGKRIGAWYLRIHPRNKVKRPLDGVIKIEKIATSRDQNEDGFETDVVNEISRSILLERLVTCYGSDSRWANHLYPIYLTELFLKSSFVSDTFFLSIF